MYTIDKRKLVVYVAAISALVLVGVFLGRCSKPSIASDNTWFNELIKSKDSINAMLTHERLVYQEYINALKNGFYRLHESDSIITQHLIDDHKLYQKLNDKLQMVSVRVRAASVSNDSLRLLLATEFGHN